MTTTNRPHRGRRLTPAGRKMFRLRPYLCRKILRVGTLDEATDAPTVHTAGKPKRPTTRDDRRAKRNRVARWRKRKGYS